MCITYGNFPPICSRKISTPSHKLLKKIPECIIFHIILISQVVTGSDIKKYSICGRSPIMDRVLPISTVCKILSQQQSGHLILRLFYPKCRFFKFGKIHAYDTKHTNRVVLDIETIGLPLENIVDRTFKSPRLQKTCGLMQL